MIEEGEGCGVMCLRRVLVVCVSGGGRPKFSFTVFCLRGSPAGLSEIITEVQQEIPGLLGVRMLPVNSLSSHVC